MLIAAAAAACFYALGVLCYVPFTPDVGFRCAFSPIVKRVTKPDRGANYPQVGDRIVQLGSFHFPQQTQLWAQVMVLRELSLRDEPLEQQRPKLTVRENAGGRVLQDQAGEVLVQESPGGAKSILVKFQRPDRPEVVTVYCPLDRFPLREMGPSLLWFFLKLGLVCIAVLVFWKRPDDRSAAQFFLLCVVTLGAYIGGYHWSRIATQPWLVLPFMGCAVLLPAVSLHFYLVFPRPKAFVVHHPRWTMLGIYGPPTAFLAALVVSYVHLRQARDSSDALPLAWETFNSQASVYMRVAAAWYLASVAALIHSYRAAGNVTERNQVKCILFGAVLALVPIGYTLYLVFWDRDDFGVGAATLPMFAASVCFTVAFAVGITRYRLMQLDQLITSGMVYFVISFLAGLMYYAVVFVGMLVSVVKEPSLGQALSVSTTALVLLLALDLVRGRVKRALDRRFDRQKSQLDRTLERMREAVEQLVDPPTLARRILQASGDLLHVTRAAIFLREGEPPIFRLAGALGDSPPPLTELTAGCPLIEALQARKALVAWSGPVTDPGQRQLKFLGGDVAYALAHDERLLAFLVLGPKVVGTYGAADLNLLAAFSQITALALESAHGHRTIEVLNRDLQTKVEKISEQQRRILALQSQLLRKDEGGTMKDEPNLEQPPTGERPVLVHPSSFIPHPSGIIGSSLAMRRLLEMVRKAAASPSAVLIQGESGTGKELLARALHDNSPRAGKPYVKVHCAALSPTLLESELFGHVKGAFTGAHRDKIGRFELAQGGTIFLDEIGDISLEVQTKLLRVLQEKTFERVGSSEPITVDVRVITATHQDLEDLIRKERFRKDLYFRLKVIPITVPPLRDRPEDIPELALHFLRVFAERARKTVTQIDDDALALLKSYSWPGNVRELENVIERAVVVAEGPTVTVAELPPELLRNLDSQEAEPDRLEMDDSLDGSALFAGLRAERAERAQRERERLVRALAAAGGNKAEAARALGLARSTLVSRLKKYGLS
jgi:transcriptional regulator with GAF, ATPase, and Fis domain